MEPIRVVHVITRMDFGGAQQNTLHTVSHLDGERFDCLLVSGEGGTLDDQVRELQSRGAKWRARFLPSLVREVSPGQDLLAFLQLLTLFIQERPQVVHTHSSKAGVLGRLAAVAARVPLIVHTYHGFGFNDFQPHWKKSLFVAIERLCCRCTDAIVFVSKANEEYARRHGLGRPERVALIRSGIKLSAFPAKVEDPAAKRAALGFGRHKLLVTSVGNLKPQKNPADFVAMAQKVNAEFPDAEFLFIGDGPLRTRLEYQVIASGLSRRLALPGWRRDTPEILAVSDVFVLTSLWEGLPRALIEAMKSGVPPVCYATDGITDVIEDGVNGLLAPIGNISALAGRVSELLRDEDLRRRLGREAARSIGEEFDIDLMVRRQEELYLEFLARG